MPTLATRCNACGTEFRVGEEQLLASDGWVRCGRCNAVFDATEMLFDADTGGAVRLVLPAAGAAGLPAADPGPGAVARGAGPAATGGHAGPVPPGLMDADDVLPDGVLLRAPSRGAWLDDAGSAPVPGDADALPGVGPVAPRHAPQPDPELEPEPIVITDHVPPPRPAERPAALAGPAEAGAQTRHGPQAADMADAAPPEHLLWRAGQTAGGEGLRQEPVLAPSPAGTPGPALRQDPVLADAEPPQAEAPAAAGWSAASTTAPARSPAGAATTAATAASTTSRSTATSTAPTPAATTPPAGTSTASPGTPQSPAAAGPASLAGTDANAGAPADTASLPSFMRSGSAAAGLGGRMPGGVMAAVVGALGLAAALQLALLLRDPLAAQVPALAPALHTACRLVGCQVRPLQRIDQVAVASSGLSRLEGSSLYRLQVVVHNRASIALATPALDLALTDAQGRLYSRRVLPPAEMGVAQAALQPGQELPIQLVLSTGGVPVDGYTVELFYP